MCFFFHSSFTKGSIFPFIMSFWLKNQSMTLKYKFRKKTVSMFSKDFGKKLLTDNISECAFLETSKRQTRQQLIKSKTCILIPSLDVLNPGACSDSMALIGNQRAPEQVGKTQHKSQYFCVDFNLSASYLLFLVHYTTLTALNKWKMARNLNEQATSSFLSQWNLKMKPSCLQFILVER